MIFSFPPFYGGFRGLLPINGALYANKLAEHKVNFALFFTYFDDIPRLPCTKRG